MKYVFGEKCRARHYVGDDCKALSLLNIWKLSRQDCLLVTRAWSPIVYFICRFQVRPLIIQLADGLVTESNCTKQINRIPHYLFQEIYADRLIVRQSINSLPKFVDKHFVTSIIEHKLKRKSVNCDSIIFVFGNDPYVCLSKDKIVDGIENILNKVGDDIPIYFSTLSKNLSFCLTNRFDNLNEIGSFSEFSQQLNDPLMVITPTTVGYDSAIEGHSVVRMEGCECPTMSMLFESSSWVSRNANDKNIHAIIYSFTDINRIKFNLNVKRRDIPCKGQFRASPVIFMKRLLGDLICLCRVQR